MTYRLIFGECDCCAKRNRVLHHATSGCGLEAYACTECQCGDLADDADDIQDEIERLLPKAESGAQWAHICALEAAYVEATGRQL